MPLDRPDPRQRGHGWDDYNAAGVYVPKAGDAVTTALGQRLVAISTDCADLGWHGGGARATG